jgi:hypothetical protein
VGGAALQLLDDQPTAKPPITFGVSGYLICRDSEAEAAAQTTALANLLSPGS